MNGKFKFETCDHIQGFLVHASCEIGCENGTASSVVKQKFCGGKVVTKEAAVDQRSSKLYCRANHGPCTNKGERNDFSVSIILKA